MRANLYALRNLLSAEPLNGHEQMLAYMQPRAIPARGLQGKACWSVSPAALRTAGAHCPAAGRPDECPWSALYVGDPSPRLSKEQRSRCRERSSSQRSWEQQLRPCPALCGKYRDRYARKHNATRIIIAKPLRPRWQEFVFGSVVDQAYPPQRHFDVYVISSQEKTQENR